MTETTDPHCGACRYFRPVDAPTGTCHRYPPAFAGENSPRETDHWRFPVVSNRAWCGEFRPPGAAVSGLEFDLQRG